MPILDENNKFKYCDQSSGNTSEVDDNLANELALNYQV
jgi:hypothetical protein